MTGAPEPLVETRSAAFGYRGKAIVSGVDLVLAEGDFVGILGPNGSGKSTLLKGLVGLLPALAGEVVRGSGAIGWVPQREALDAVFPLTVEEVVHMGAYGRLAGWRRLARADREEALELLAGDAVEIPVLGDRVPGAPPSGRLRWNSASRQGGRTTSVEATGGIELVEEEAGDLRIRATEAYTVLLGGIRIEVSRSSIR